MDEFQFSCYTPHVAELRLLIDGCVKKAGEYLKMECPLASDSVWGSSWLYTH